MNEENKFLGNEKISKLLLKFSIPCILSLLISSLYNIVDQIFIGNSEIGYLGNAATTVVFPITIISVAFAWCLGDGSAAFLSLCQGRKNTKDADKAIGNSILISFVISILFVALGFIFMDKLLYLFGASNSSIGLAKDYFTIILSAIPIYMLANTVNSIIRADGSPTYSMISTLIGAILNIILDPIFIFVFKMGIKGAAWATIIGQIVSFIVSFAYFFKSKTFKLSLNSFKIINTNIKKSKEGVIITISREHGSQGKYIGKLIADKLEIPYYYKEMTAIAAKESGLDKEFVSKINQSSNIMHDLYLTTSPVQYAIDAQNKAIRKIAEKGSCVLVGRAADYVLQDYKNLIRIFIYAPKDYRVRNVIEMYNDSQKDAIKNVEKSDKNRASYYKIISGKTWGDINNYDLCINSSIGKEKTADIICEYINKINNNIMLKN